MADLNSLLPTNSGWVLEEATAINNNGQVVGFGTHNGQTRAFLLDVGTLAAVRPDSQLVVDVAGVEAHFDELATEGLLSVTAISNLASLPTDAVQATADNQLFSLTTNRLSVTQAWDVHYSGELNGPLTLVFSYDPQLLPLGIDEMSLRIWHYDSALDQWQIGGVADPLNHTISFTTTSLSPFVLAAVPEPSTFVLAGMGLGMLACQRLIRRARRATRTLK